VGNAKVKPRDSQGSEPWRPSEPHQKGNGRILWEMPEEYLQTLSITFWDSSRDTLRNYSTKKDWILLGLFPAVSPDFSLVGMRTKNLREKTASQKETMVLAQPDVVEHLLYCPSIRGSCMKVKYDKKQQEFQKLLKFAF
jgi:hypothetical protein